MKKVIIVSNYFTPEMGAAPNRITSLAKSLSEEGFDVTVFCPLPNYPHGKVFEGYRGRIGKREKIDNIKVHRLWTYPSISKRALPRILSMMSFSLSVLIRMLFCMFSKPDFFIVQSPPLLVSFTAMFSAKKLLRVRTILNISDLWPKTAIELGAISEGRFLKLLYFLEKFIYRNADQITGQSDEIIAHINSFTECPKMTYRNLPRHVTPPEQPYAVTPDTKKLVYAGLLGAAQGILSICQNTDFRALNCELHIYGKGMEEEQIVAFLKENPERGIRFWGAFAPDQVNEILSPYDAALVPLATRIYGAVPSKLFELVHLHLPVLFSGGGEGATIVEKEEIGLVAEPGDMESFNDMVRQFSELGDTELLKMSDRQKVLSQTSLNYYSQFKKLKEFIN